MFFNHDGYRDLFADVKNPKNNLYRIFLYHLVPGDVGYVFDRLHSAHPNIMTATLEKIVARMRDNTVNSQDDTNSGSSSSSRTTVSGSSISSGFVDDL
jgi:hypothetical protein